MNRGAEGKEGFWRFTDLQNTEDETAVVYGILQGSAEHEDEHKFTHEFRNLDSVTNFHITLPIGALRNNSELMNLTFYTSPTSFTPTIIAKPTNLSRYHGQVARMRKWMEQQVMSARAVDRPGVHHGTMTRLLRRVRFCHPSPPRPSRNPGEETASSSPTHHHTNSSCAQATACSSLEM